MTKSSFFSTPTINNLVSGYQHLFEIVILLLHLITRGQKQKHLKQKLIYILLIDLGAKKSERNLVLKINDLCPIL